MGVFQWLVATLVLTAAVPWLLWGFQNQPASVVVHDVAGFPIPGAKGRLLSLDRVLEVKAKADGELQFDGVVPGTYDLEVTASGFHKRVYSDLHIPIGGPQPMDVVLAPDIPCGPINAIDYQAVRPTAGVLSGYVISADTDKGISGVKIELTDAVSHGQVGETVTGHNGDFAFQSLPAGRYRLQTSKKAWESTEISEFLVPRENLTILHLHMDKSGHFHICQ